MGSPRVDWGPWGEDVVRAEIGIHSGEVRRGEANLSRGQSL